MVHGHKKVKNLKRLFVAKCNGKYRISFRSSFFPARIYTLFVTANQKQGRNEGISLIIPLIFVTIHMHVVFKIKFVNQFNITRVLKYYLAVKTATNHLD